MNIISAMDFLKRISIYYLITAFLLLLCLLGIFQFGLKQVLLQLLPPVLATTLAGVFFDYLETKKWQKPLTPLITGLIIGFVASFGEQPLTLIFIGISAMLIKFLVKLEGRHLFNPAASGLLVGLLLFNSHPSWWSGGDHLWPFLIWTPLLIYKFKRWAPMVGFLIPLLIFDGIAILLSSSLLFFILVMLIEPKTSPYTIRNGLIYGLIVATGYILLGQTILDPLIPSLLIGNLGARLLGKILV